MVRRYHGNLDMQDGVTLMPIVQNPRSVGTVRLKSADYKDAPVIDPKFLTVRDDVSVAVEG